LPQNEVRVASLYLYGKPVVRNLTPEALGAIRFLLEEEIQDVPFIHYLRFSNGKFCSNSAEYTRGEKHKDDVVFVDEGKYCQVKQVVLLKYGCVCVDELNCHCEVRPIIILLKYRVSSSHLFLDRELGISSVNIVQLNETVETVAIHPCALRGMCFIVEKGVNSYAIVMPNSFETD
jgi:hypothetical protein